MERCTKLNDEIEFLIRNGYLKEYIRGNKIDRKEPKVQRSSSRVVGKAANLKNYKYHRKDDREKGYGRHGVWRAKNLCKKMYTYVPKKLDE